MRFWLLFLVTFILFAADINITLIQGDTQTFSQLLSGLTQRKQKSEDINLQKALLKKLIDLEKQAHKIVPETLHPPQKEEDLLALFEKYIGLVKQKSLLSQTIKSLDEKLDILRSQIRALDSNATNLMDLELQYTFYLKEKAIAQEKLETIDKTLQQIKDLFKNGIKKIPISSFDISKDLKSIEENLQKIGKKIQFYDVELERRVLLGKNTSWLRKQIEIWQKKERKEIDKKLQLLFKEYLFALQSNDSKKVFSLKKEIKKLSTHYYSTATANAIDDLLSNLATAILGKAQTLKGATFEEAKTILKTFWKKVNEPLFTLNGVPISLFKLFIAFTILIIGMLIGAFYKRYVKSISYRSKNFTQSTATLLANLGYYLLVIIAFFLSLHTLGIDLSSLAIVAGALSVGIGFGLQNVVSNFVSGIILMFEGSIKIGDYLEIDGELSGHVNDIRMRSTTITTNDNIDVIVPNQDLIQNKVINWTMNDRIRRFRIPFSVAYGTDVKKVIRVVKEAVEKSGFGDIYTTRKRQTRVIMTEMADSGVNFELFVWIKGEEILYPRRTKSRFLILIYEALNANGIEIPFPQRDIHIRQGDSPIEILLKKESE